LHQNAPKCTVPRAPARNEPNSARRDDPLPDDELTPRQLQAIALLFAGRSYTDVGRELKINRSTLFRWRRSPTFIDEVRRRYAMSARRTVTVNGRRA
jgi:DNA-binding CsgD family transcriptional regulator